MSTVQCKKCGGMVDIPEDLTAGECPYCCSITTFPKLKNDHAEQLFNRAEHFRQINDFDKAVACYENIIQDDPENPDAYWGLVISRFGIEYVEDPVSHERIPTCHRAQYESILADRDYLNVLEYSSGIDRDIYEKEAARIAEIQKRILAISNQEKPYDVFICYKETTEGGSRTKDSALAQDIYYQLTNEKYKVFFSRITLEDKLGQEYEPYIFAALNSAKVMLVIGSKPEYFNAVWVRNEWSRFLSLMKKDRSRLLIPCYRDMDAYELPEELSMFQSQDMSKIGFIQDILHGVKKTIQKSPSTGTAATASIDMTGKKNPLLRRVVLLLEDKDFNTAINMCNQVLNQEPENGWAYFYMIMAEMNIANTKELPTVNFEKNKNFKFALRFADVELKSELEQMRSAYLRIEEEKRHRKAEEIRCQAEKDVSDILKAQSKERLNLLLRHIKFEKRPDILNFLQECVEKEKMLINSPKLNTEIVKPIKEASKQAMLAAGDLKTKERKLILRAVIILSISCFSLFFFICIFTFVNKLILKESLKNGNVCRIENNVVVGVRYDKKDIIKCIIPDGVTTIGKEAFHGCDNLQSVSIPNSVIRIGRLAFPSDCEIERYDK